MPENKAEAAGGGNKKDDKNPLSGLLAFLKEYSIIGMAIGVIIAQTTTALINSVVKGLFTPLINLMVPGDRLDSLVFSVGHSQFDVGSIISALLTFLIVLVFIYIIVKKILKNEGWLKKS